MTLEYLSRRRKIEIPERRKKTTETIRVIGATTNNLKNLNAEFPLRKFVCITGVSGVTNQLFCMMFYTEI